MTACIDSVLSPQMLSQLRPLLPRVIQTLLMSSSRERINSYQTWPSSELNVDILKLANNKLMKKMQFFPGPSHLCNVPLKGEHPTASKGNVACKHEMPCVFWGINFTMFQFRMISYLKTKRGKPTAKERIVSGHCTTFQIHLVQCFNNCQILPSDWVTFYLVDWYKWHFSTGLVESGSCHLEYESIAWTKLVVERDLNFGQAFCMRWRSIYSKIDK